MGVAASVIGVAGTVAYYFARYGFKHPDEKRDEELQEASARERAGLAAGAPNVAAKSEPAVEVRPTVVLDKPVAPPLKVVTPPVSLDSALAKTRQSLWGRVQKIFTGAAVNEGLREQLEEILYTSDLGTKTVERLLEGLEARLSRAESKDFNAVCEAMKKEMFAIFADENGNIDSRLKSDGSATAEEVANLLLISSQGAQPAVLLVVGVNGVGKTTTIGKLSHLFAQSGKKVLVAAGDTFRAAAGEQLHVWTERAQVEIFSPQGVTDPAAVAYQALEHSRTQAADVVIIDTAGRLHTQKNLMEELKKIKRVLSKLDANAPHETLLVLDANSGQNAIVQAREFNEALQLTGVILTKMDGSAKGGVALALKTELDLMPKLIGVGEGIKDLRPFEPKAFVEAIF